MNIVKNTGGLANQMLHYIFSRYIEITNDCDVYLDNSCFDYWNPHNGFELDKMFPNIKLKLLCDVYDESLYERAKPLIVNPNLRKQGFEILGLKKMLILSNCFDNYLVRDAATFNYDKCKYLDINYETNKLQYIENKYIMGYNFNPIYFNTIKKEMLYELTFQDIPENDLENKKYLKLIESNISVAIHIRRGDFVNLGLDKGPEKYIEPIAIIRKKIESTYQKPHFFIITNDPEWVKENIKEHGLLPTDNVIVIEGNTVDAKNYIDMQLMSHCKYIISNGRSTFSRVAAMLNQNIIESMCVW